MTREHLGSRLGFILLSAGCAIGIGNVWKFPYMAGEYGGAVFVLFYILFLVILGLPIMTMEFAVGRASQQSPITSFKKLEKSGHKWHLHGYAALIGNYLLVMFYTTVAGWMLHYFFLTAKGTFLNLNTEEISTVFGDMLSSPLTMIFWMAVNVILGFLVCSFSLKNGLERVSKIMMVALLVIMVGIAIYSICLDGGKEGLKFYLMPDFSKAAEIGLGKVIVGAMNQSFFTLSLGIGSMAIFGSYLGKDRALLGESVNIAVLDTFVALTSGLIIFPACYSFGIKPDSGPGLIFKTLPNVFKALPYGRVIGSFFFIFLTFAAFSTLIAVFENIISCWMDLKGISRKKAAFYNCIAILVLSVPCVLGFNIWSGFTPLGSNTNISDLEDFIVSNIMLPLGSLIYLLFCTSRYGWGWKNFKEEANTGEGLKVKNWMRPYLTYILPLIVIIIFVIGLIDKF